MTDIYDEMTIPELMQRMQLFEQKLNDLIGHIASVSKLMVQTSEASVSRAPACSWSLKKPRRSDALSWPIYQFLKTSFQEGKDKPTAMDVLEAFEAQKPPEVIEIMQREVKYTALTGQIKIADLEDIRGRIYRMTNAIPECKRSEFS